MNMPAAHRDYNSTGRDDIARIDGMYHERLHGASCWTIGICISVTALLDATEYLGIRFWV